MAGTSCGTGAMSRMSLKVDLRLSATDTQDPTRLEKQPVPLGASASPEPNKTSTTQVSELCEVTSARGGEHVQCVLATK
eukprot:4496023-Amphidinium_carterae.1